MVACRPDSTWPWSTAGTLDRITALFSEGAELYGAMVAAPIPVIVSCTGHALAGGALLLLSADYRIGRNGTYRLGLNETRIGLALPNFAVDPGHASTRAPVPDRGHHVRRGRLAGAGGGDGLPRRDRGRSPAEGLCARAPSWPPAAGAVRGDQAPYQADACNRSWRPEARAGRPVVGGPKVGIAPRYRVAISLGEDHSQEGAHARG